MEVEQAASSGLKGRNFQVGRKMFAAGLFRVSPFCKPRWHERYDLTGSGGRYSPHDLLEQIMYPSKEINEQFTHFRNRKMGNSIRSRSEP